MPKKALFLAATVILSAVLASCGGSDGRNLSPAAREQIRNAAAISIVVEVEPKGLLPLTSSVQKVLERVFVGLGLEVARGPDAFPVFLVRISAEAVGRSYWVENGGYETESYSGAAIKGEMALAQTEKDKLTRGFSGRIQTDRDRFFAIEDPLDAPYAQALQQSDFLAAVAGMIDSCWGRARAESVMAGLYDETLPWRDWRSAVLRSMEPFSDAGATSALRAILVRHVERLADPSADTAFDDCLVRLLEMLAARSDRASRPTVVLLMGKLFNHNHHGPWGDSRSVLQEVAARLR
jgi:hypothetical protein